ncbi:carbohydrate-binding protein [Pedobacter deserti]|uniref:carbohydrate-binding protein n=1 Tax=Pedobacter deserti TaxID=2817382 RepID=UPI002108E6C4|nr:carbohydrate-binding protein [Pedobacter sp. SYSU D00382]
MKRILTYTQIGLLAAAFLASSCEREKLDDVFAEGQFKSVSVSMPKEVVVGTGSNATLSSDALTLPVTINFDAPTSRAFVVNLSSNVDTIQTLIDNNTLPAGTIALGEGDFSLPPVLNVPIGVTSASFDLVIGRSFLERNHGKNVALAVKVTDAAKGNAIKAGQNSTVLTIKTGEVLTADDVHLVGFNTQSNVTTVSTFSRGSQDITVSIPLVLTGEAGSPFTVDVAEAPEVVAQITPQHELIPDAEWSIVATNIRFVTNSNVATLEISARRNKLTSVAQGGKMWAVGLKLTNPSRYVLNENKSSLVVVFNPDTFRPYNDSGPFRVLGAIGATSPMIVAAEYDYGGQGISYNDNNSKDGDANFRYPDGVDVSADYNPRSVIGWTNAGEWLTYSVIVEEAGVYEMNMIAGANNADGRYKVEFGSTVVAENKAATNTGGHNNQQPHYSEVTLPAGRHIMKVTWTAGNHDWRGIVFKRLR